MEQSLKGADLGEGRELSLFSPGQWFHHTHAKLIQGGVISYVARQYSGGLDVDQIRSGMRVLFFLGGDAAPSGFPAGALFLSIDGGYDRGERAGDVVVALQEGPYAEFDHLISLKAGDRVRLPDGLTLRLMGHSHKRPTNDGPRRETTELEASTAGQTTLLLLAHVIESDSSSSWGSETFGPYTIELRGMDDDGKSTVVVRKPGRSSEESDPDDS